MLFVSGTSSSKRTVLKPSQNLKSSSAPHVKPPPSATFLGASTQSITSKVKGANSRTVLHRPLESNTDVTAAAGSTQLNSKSNERSAGSLDSTGVVTLEKRSPTNTSVVARLSETSLSRSPSVASVNNSHVTTEIAAPSVLETNPISSQKHSSVPCNSQFVWVNSKLLQADNTTASSETSAISSTPRLHTGYVTQSKYKLTKVKSPQTATKRTPRNEIQLSKPKHNLKALGRYKLVRKSTPIRSKNYEKELNKPKHSLKPVGKYKLVPKLTASGGKLQVTKRAYVSPYFAGIRKSSPRISKSGKRIISRYKISRRSTEKKIAQGASPRLKKPKSYKIDRRQNIVLRSKYKIDKLKAVRKPVQFETLTPKRDRRSFKWVKQGLQESPKVTFVSPFKLCLHSNSPIGK